MRKTDEEIKERIEYLSRLAKFKKKQDTWMFNRGRLRELRWVLGE